MKKYQKHEKTLKNTKNIRHMKNFKNIKIMKILPQHKKIWKIPKMSKNIGRKVRMGENPMTMHTPGETQLHWLILLIWQIFNHPCTVAAHRLLLLLDRTPFSILEINHCINMPSLAMWKGNNCCGSTEQRGPTTLTHGPFYKNVTLAGVGHF